MDTTLLDRIKYSLQFNESLTHNIFLAIALVVTAIILLSFVALIIKMTKRSSRIERKIGNTLSFPVLLWAIFPFGLFLLIDVSLSADGSAAATNEAISYEQDGKQVTAMITNRFTANSSVRGIVSGSSTSSVIAFEPETGKKLFSQKIIPKKSSVIDTAKLLSVSDDQIFTFYAGTIFVLNQKNGKIEHKIDSANSVPISSSSDFCKFDSSLNEVVFTCTDGLVYSLNLASLKTKKQPTIQANQYFAEKDLSDIDFARGITLQVLRNDKYNMFLSDSEIQNIEAGSKELPDSSLQDRRYLYTGNLDKPNELKKLNQQVFIGGGFLPKNESTLIDSYSSIDRRTNRNYSTYQEVAIHGETNSTGPFQLANPNQYLVVHRASTESSSNILLSCIDISSEQTLWTIDTEGDDIEGYTQIDKNHILLLCSKVNETSGAANTSHTLYLSLKDGSGKGYFFKYNKSFDIKKETN